MIIISLSEPRDANSTFYNYSLSFSGVHNTVMRQGVLCLNWEHLPTKLPSWVAPWLRIGSGLGMELQGEVVWGYGCMWLWFGRLGGYARLAGENWVERGSKWWKIKGVSGLRKCEAVV